MAKHKESYKLHSDIKKSQTMGPKDVTIKAVCFKLMVWIWSESEKRQGLGKCWESGTSYLLTISLDLLMASKFSVCFKPEKAEERALTLGRSWNTMQHDALLHNAMKKARAHSFGVHPAVFFQAIWKDKHPTRTQSLVTWPILTGTSCQDASSCLRHHVSKSWCNICRSGLDCNRDLWW